MRILLVVDIAYEAGGAEKSVRLIAENLRHQGHSVCILSTDKNAVGHDIFADELVAAISGPATLRLIKHLWYPAAYSKSRSIIRDFRPDIVHLHTISEFSPSLLWGLGKTPSILTIHGPEEFTTSLLPWLLPASDYRHYTYAWEDIRLIGRMRYAYYRYFQRLAYRLALRRLKLVIAPSKFMARVLAHDFATTSIIQIYNGINLQRAKPLPANQRILYVGRLEAVKGIDHLLHAFARVHQAHPKAKLRIVGDGTRRRELEHLAKNLDIGDSVEFAGWVAPQSVHQEFENAILLVIPSVWPENLPTVAIEALAVGRPIVGSDIGGIPELVSSYNGYIVPVGDERGLAESIDRFIADPEKLHRASVSSTITAKRFSFTIFLKKLLIVYSDVLNENTHN